MRCWHRDSYAEFEDYMNRHVKFPPSNEIKRILSAWTKAGLPIGSVEIHEAGMTIHPQATELGGSAYEQWKGAS